VRPGESRSRIALTLKMAYSDGLLSHDTFARRIDQVFKAHLIDPVRFVGDLADRRAASSPLRRVAALTRRLRRSGARRRMAEPSSLLALDWDGGKSELLVGRHSGCDVVLSDQTVSRHHACLIYRDGVWVLHDLQSTNGTTVNGAAVDHCVLHPGDELVLGAERLRID